MWPQKARVVPLDLEEELIMIDSGVGLEPEKIVRNIKNDNLAINKLSRILLSHSHVDHAGGAYFFQDSMSSIIFGTKFILICRIPHLILI